MRENLTLQQVDDEIRQLAAALRNPQNVPAQQGLRYEPRAGTSFSNAIQCIYQGRHRRQDVMAGKFDKEIQTLFTSYLANKYPGASQESIQHHAASWNRRARSLTRQAVWNTAGTAVSTLLTTVAPKLGIALGSYAGAIGVGTGITVGSALVPALLAALPVGAAIGASVVARHVTRDTREARKAGNILHKVLHEGPELRAFRTAIRDGTDIYEEFDKLIKKSDRIPEKYSNKLWLAGMLGTSAILGTIGAGGYEIGDKLWKEFAANSPPLIGPLGNLAVGNNFSELMTKFWAEVSGSGTGPWAGKVGWQQMTGLGEYFWKHAAAALWLRPMPQ